MKNSIDFDKSLLIKLIALKAVTWFASCAVIVVIYHYFDIALPYEYLARTLILSSFIVLVWLARLRFSLPVTEVEVFALLLSDLIILSILIEFSGQSANPFTSSLLVPLALAAALLRKMYSLPLMVLAVLLYARWTFGGNAHHMDHSSFSLHLYGMWINFAISAVILFVFITYATDSVRRRDTELQQTREKILRDEQLVAIATQTATTAHALGSPLSSMAILLEEWEREGRNDEEMEIFKQELNRCRSYLSGIGAASKEQKNSAQKPQPVSEFYEELQQHYQLLKPEAELQFSFDSVLNDQCLDTTGSLLLAIANLIDNAVEAKSKRISIHFSIQNDRLEILIVDNGEGISSDTKSKLGKAFIDSSKEGWGMGVYLSHSTIEYYGGTISIVDAKQGGTETRVILPLASSKNRKVGNSLD